MKSKSIAELKQGQGGQPLLRYVLYARKSSEDVGSQAKSLPDQIADCLKYAEDKGIVVVETLKESHSAKISGRRLVFSQMLKDLETGKYDGILAWHPDRLARNSLEAGMIVDMVDSGKIKDLKFPTLEFTNDSSGKLLLNIMFAMSKQYSEHLSESVQRGVDSNLKQGKSGGMPKWGYNRDEVTGFYEPDENFDLVKRGLRMYIEGHSQRDIIRFWREHDVHRMTKLTRRNKNVHRVTIYNSEGPIGTILGDPFYYGVLVQGGQKVDLREILPDFQPMLTEEEFEQIQALRRKIKKIPTASVKAKENKVFIPFRQFVKCGVCGNFMHVARSTARSGKKFLYFRCGNPECERKQKNIRAQYVLNDIYETLEALHFTKKDVEKIQNHLTDYINHRHNELIEEKLRINAAIKAKKRRQGELSQAFIDLGSDAPKEAKKMVKEQLEECREDIADLQVERDEINDKIFDPDQVQDILDELTNQLDSLADKMKSGDSWQKDQLARNLFTNLEINNKNEVSYRVRRPLESLISGRLTEKSRSGEGRVDVVARLCMVVDWCIDHPEYTAKIKVIPKKDYPVLMPCEF